MRAGCDGCHERTSAACFFEACHLPITDRLRHYRDAELPKVIVQRRSRTDSQVVDDDLAGAVGEAPTGGCALLEENPGSLDLAFADEVNLRHVAMKEGSAGDERSRHPFPGDQ